MCEDIKFGKMEKLGNTSCVMCDDSLPAALEKNRIYNSKVTYKLSPLESKALCKVLRLPSFPFDFQFLQAFFCNDCKTYIKKSSVIFDQIESLNLHLTQIRSVMLNKLAKFATVLHSHTSAQKNLEEVNIRDKPFNDSSFRWEIRKQVFHCLQANAGKEVNLGFEGGRRVTQEVPARVEKGHNITYCLEKTEKEISSPQSMNSELSQHDYHQSPDDPESDLSSQQGCSLTKAHTCEESSQGSHLSPQVVENQEPASNSETVNLLSVESNDIDHAEIGYDNIGSQKSPAVSENDNIQTSITEFHDGKPNERLNYSSTSSNDVEKLAGQSTPTEGREGNIDKHCQTEEPVYKLEEELRKYEQTLAITTEPMQRRVSTTEQEDFLPTLPSNSKANDSMYEVVEVEDSDESDSLVVVSLENKRNLCSQENQGPIENKVVSHENEIVSSLHENQRLSPPHEDQTVFPSHKNRSVSPSHDSQAVSSLKNQVASPNKSQGSPPQENQGSSSQENIVFPQENQGSSPQENIVSSQENQGSSPQENIVTLQENQVVSPHENQIASPHENQKASPHENQIVSPHENQIASPRENQIVPPHENQIASPHENQIASPHENQIASPHENEIASPCENQIASPHENEVTSPHENEVTSPHENEVTSPHENEVTSPHENQVASPNENQVASPNDNQIASPHENQIASPNENQIASPNENQIASPHENQVTSPNENQIASPHENQVTSPHENQVTSPHENQIASHHENQVVSPHENNVASPHENNVASPHENNVASPHENQVGSPHENQIVPSQKNNGSPPHEVQIISSQESQDTQTYEDVSSFRKGINIQCSLDFSALTESDNEGESVGILLIPGIDYTLDETQKDLPSKMLTEMDFTGQGVYVSVENSISSEATSSVSKMNLPPMMDETSINDMNVVNAIPAELDFSEFAGTDNISTSTVEVSTTGLPEIHFSQIVSSSINLQSGGIEMCPFSTPSIPADPSSDIHLQLSTDELSSFANTHRIDRNNSDISKGMPELIPVSPAVESGSISSESDMEPPKLLNEKLLGSSNLLPEHAVVETSSHHFSASATYVHPTWSNTTSSFFEEKEESRLFSAIQTTSSVASPISSIAFNQGSSTESPIRSKNDTTKAHVIRLPCAQLISPQKQCSSSFDDDSSKSEDVSTGLQPADVSKKRSPDVTQAGTVAGLSHIRPDFLSSQPNKAGLSAKESESSKPTSLVGQIRNKTFITKASLKSHPEPLKNYDSQPQRTKPVGVLKTGSAEPLSFEFSFSEVLQVISKEDEVINQPQPPAPAAVSTPVSIQESSKGGEPKIKKPRLLTKKHSTPLVTTSAFPKVNSKAPVPIDDKSSDDEISIVAEYRHPGPSVPMSYSKNIEMHKIRLQAKLGSNSRRLQAARRTQVGQKKPKVKEDLFTPDRSVQKITASDHDCRNIDRTKKTIQCVASTPPRGASCKNLEENTAGPAKKRSKSDREYSANNSAKTGPSKDNETGSSSNKNQVRTGRLRLDNQKSKTDRDDSLISVKDKSQLDLETDVFASYSKRRIPKSGSVNTNLAETEREKSPAKKKTKSDRDGINASPSMSTNTISSKECTNNQVETEQRNNDSDINAAAASNLGHETSSSLSISPLTSRETSASPTKSHLNSNQESSVSYAKKVSKTDQGSSANPAKTVPLPETDIVTIYGKSGRGSSASFDKNQLSPKFRRRHVIPMKTQTKTPDPNIVSLGKPNYLSDSSVSDISDTSSNLSSSTTDEDFVPSPDISDISNKKSRPKRLVCTRKEITKPKEPAKQKRKPYKRGKRNNPPVAKDKVPVTKTSKTKQRTSARNISKKAAKSSTLLNLPEVTAPLKVAENATSWTVAKIAAVTNRRILNLYLEKLNLNSLMCPEGVFIGGEMVKVNMTSLTHTKPTNLGETDAGIPLNKSTAMDGVPAGGLANSGSKKLKNCSQLKINNINEDFIEDTSNEKVQLKAKPKSHKKSHKKMSDSVNRQAIPISVRQQINRLLRTDPPSVPAAESPSTNPPVPAAEGPSANPPVPADEGPSTNPHNENPPSIPPASENSAPVSPPTDNLLVPTPSQTKIKRPIKITISKKRHSDGTESVAVTTPRKSIDDDKCAKEKSAEPATPTVDVAPKRRPSKSESRIMETTFTKKEVGQTSSGRKVVRCSYE